MFRFFSRKDADYERVSPDQDDSATLLSEEKAVPPLKRSSIRHLLVILAAVCFSLAIVTFAAAYSKLANLYTEASDTPRPCKCGNSTIEARAMGCEYDSLASAWLPVYCRDDELTAEFDRSGPGIDGAWPYFADIIGNKSLTVEEVSMLADVPGAVYYTTWEWHATHCGFYWRKLSKASQDQVQERYAGMHHINHCIMTMAGVALDSTHSITRDMQKMVGSDDGTASTPYLI